MKLHGQILQHLYVLGKSAVINSVYKKRRRRNLTSSLLMCFQEFNSALRKIQEKFESQKDKHHLVPPTKLREYSSWMANFNPNRESRELEIPGMPLLFAVCRYNLVLDLIPSSSCAFRSLQLSWVWSLLILTYSSVFCLSLFAAAQQRLPQSWQLWPCLARESIVVVVTVYYDLIVVCLRSWLFG